MSGVKRVYDEPPEIPCPEDLAAEGIVEVIVCGPDGWSVFQSHTRAIAESDPHMWERFMVPALKAAKVI
jgi:hypothetical protein